MQSTTNLTTVENTLATMLEDGRAFDHIRATFDHPTDGPTPIDVGTYVGSAMGHYSTSEAIGIARSLGWAPVDEPELDYWLDAYGHAYSSDEMTLDDHNARRLAIGLGPIDESAYDDIDFTAGELLSEYLDDAEAWLDERTTIDTTDLVSALVDESDASESDARQAIDDEMLGAYWSYNEGWGLQVYAESLTY